MKIPTESLKRASIASTCEQDGCETVVQTWCPLCERFLCHRHDELYPRRRHDCLRGPAEAA